MFPLPEGQTYITQMPEKGKSEQELLTMMKNYKGMGKLIFYSLTECT